MSSNCLNVNDHSLIVDITWSSSFKNEIELYQRLIFKKTLIYHSNFTKTFIFAQNMIFCKIKSFISCIETWDLLLKNKKIVFFFQSLMKRRLSNLIKYRSSNLMKYDSSNLMKYNSSRLMKCRLSNLMKSRLIKFDERSFVSSLMNRFRQIWWIVFVEFDESFSSNLMSRFIKSLSFRKIELNFVRHLEKIRIEQSKYKRWDDQTWSRKRIHRNIFCKKENLKSHFSITFHISRQDATRHVISIFATRHVINIFATRCIFRKNIRNRSRKKKIIKKKNNL
jgi:hypothetical protein